MKRYSPERKDAILKKLSPPENRSVAEVAKEEGIPVQTLYAWRKKLRETGKPVPGNKNNSEQWSAEMKLAVVTETLPLSETELSQYCREHGLYPEQVAAWKAACLQGFGQASTLEKEAIHKTKADQQEIKSLKKELRFKEKALAEATALLVLRKKLRAFYGEDLEDD